MTDEDSPAVKLLYCIWTLLGQQCPSTRGCHIFTNGVHCAQVMATATPSAKLTVMMMNHTKILTHPEEIRRTVMANDVLLQHAARIEKVPARLVRSK